MCIDKLFYYILIASSRTELSNKKVKKVRTKNRSKCVIHVHFGSPVNRYSETQSLLTP